ncbi:MULTISPECIES: TadE family protein [Streptomyces]|nr:MULTISPECIES: TadE family protein [Streptomyces]MBQ0953797.1 pilus assembly protein [Streptomyces sp. RK76]REH18350.1 TadE-like protein [Streptomyces sp. 2221.1]WTE23794.1 pilus assembly protein [Streptomyces anthocyanicus]SDS20180.1 TadE-like protein [Streptomyces sp. 2114.2]
MPSNARLTAWWRRRRRADDRGDASIQMAIVFPFVLLATIAVIQASMWYYARQIALTAAREGVTAARTYQAGPADGTARARQVLERTAGDSLRSVSVSARSDGERVRVQVSGTAQSMIPGVPGLTITQSASGPVERWVQP